MAVHRDPFEMLEELIVAVLAYPWVDNELEECLLVAMATVLDVQVTERQFDEMTNYEPPDTDSE